MRIGLLLAGLIVLGSVVFTSCSDSSSDSTPIIDVPTVVEPHERAGALPPMSSNIRNYPEQRIISTLRDIRQEWSGGRCEGTGNVSLSSPINPDLVELIAPYGLMIDAHVTPIDHQYWSPKGPFMNTNPTQVLAPANGFVVSVQHMVSPVGDKRQTAVVDDYRVILEHSCTFYTYFIHIGRLSQQIMSAFNAESNGGFVANIRVRISRGEVLGWITRPVDFAVIDTTRVLQGFIHPDHYGAEPWKVHTVDPFDYFSEPVRTQLLARNPRTALPRGGKIDYDSSGFLIGNWFAQGTGGYGGIKQEEYWRGHLSFAPDAYDPLQYVMSTGDFNGVSRQFGIQTESSPERVNVESGMVKFGLSQYDYVANGTRWSRWQYAGPITASTQGMPIEATVLVQMLGPESLKAEFFAVPPSEVGGFLNPVLYER